MSQRTIVEFNHDYGREIKENPEEFVRLIRQMINHGSNDSELQKQLRRFGVTTTPTGHHSDKRIVSLCTSYSVKPYFEKEF